MSVALDLKLLFFVWWGVKGGTSLQVDHRRWSNLLYHLTKWDTILYYETRRNAENTAFLRVLY